jgi:multiple sugar transport system permease protein
VSAPALGFGRGGAGPSGRRLRGLGRGALWAVLALSLLTMLFPLYWMALLSLKTEGFALSGPGSLLPTGLTFQNYRDVWAAGPFGRYFLNSAVVAAVVVAGNLLFASMVGYAFARRRFTGKRSLWLAILATLMIPKQIIMIPLYILVAKAGILDTYAALTLPFLVDAFNVFLMRQYIQQLPVDLEEAARVDGAGDWAVFWRVVLPLARPALAVVGINTFLVNWNSFLYPLILTSSEKMRTIPVGLALYSQGQHAVDWGHLMAGSMLATLPVLAVFLIFQRHIIEGITAGAGK